ncbi:MAG: AAA family ATPase [Chthonomonadales bacterium]|nr:AAA family ATPase [Chthonomonadales bacterium]
MPRDRERGRASNGPQEEAWDLPETQVRAIGLLNEVIRMTPRGDPRLDHLLLLRHQLATDEKQLEEAQKVIAEFEEAYAKLTSPANRIGVFIRDLENETVLIAMGDQEYVANVDPKLEERSFEVGTRIKVNEAFTVLGDMGYHPGGPLVKITSVLDDERLRVSMDSQGTQSRVIYRASNLTGAVLKPGDEVRVEPNFKVALEHFPMQETQEYFLEEVPDLPWSKIGGQEEVIDVIKDAIELPLLHPELFARFEKRPLKGILLYGPPGCGKTLIGKATAYNLTREYRERTKRDVKEYFMYISGPKVLNMWLGETERMVREIFATAREKAKDGHLVFLFIDEAESVLRTRSSGRWLNISNTVVPQFCAEMDGLVSLENVVVMLTSNRPDYIDPAILRPERIDRKVKVGRPDRRASREILGIYLHEGIPIDPDLVRQHKGDAVAGRDELLDLTIDYMWRRNEETEFLEVYLRSGGVETLHWKDLASGALVKSFVERAKDFVIKRSVAKGSAEEGVTLDDLQRAVRVEYKENEIFPKSDTQEDWLKLLDYEPENVATVKPIRARRPPARRNII